MDTISKAFETILTDRKRGVVTLQINRPEENNSINNLLLEEMMEVLRDIESDPTQKVLVIQGNEKDFCTGMDFKAVAAHSAAAGASDLDSNRYYDMLRHITTCSKIVVVKVDGKVNAGGMGIVAASDIVLSGEKATYGLSEALFGLLPACVMPFLIRRVGYQKAQWMTLMTGGITAERAFQIGLVDELSPAPDQTLRTMLLRLTRLEGATVKDLKEYMSKLWIIEEDTQKLAVDKITGLVNSEKVRSNISNFVNNNIFPWNK